MLFRKHIVSTRTLFQLTVALVFFLVAAVGAAVAANSGNAPLLVPYTINTVAGTPQFTSTGAAIAGYAGDGGPAVPYLSKGTVVAGSTFSGPNGMAVDSVGNIYILDKGNAVIREVNYATGTVNTIAGMDPTGCSGVSCAVHTSGCADGVQAYGSKVGSSLAGIAVDAYGNVYFVDGGSSSVSVIYRGGTQVAAFITLVNPAGVAKSGGTVQVGYMYHIAGTVSLTTCGGTVSPVTDNALAYENSDAPGATAGATLRSPTFVTLDSAGNIYIADIGNATVRVINTQATPQTFFQYTVQPGYMRSITDANALLTTGLPLVTTSFVGTGINGPANAIVYNSQYKGGFADAYGNIYQVNGSGSGTGAPGIYSSAAYAGGAPLTNLLTVEAPMLASVYGPTYPVPAGDLPTPAELPLTYGNSYIIQGNPSLTSALPDSFPNVLAVTNEEYAVRQSSLMADVFGTMWYLDNHYPELSRVDQYTSDALDLIGSQHQRALASNSPINTSPATFTNPWYCIYGASPNIWTQGPVSYDPEGDGCPSIVAYLGGGPTIALGDGLGNIYLTDPGDDVIRELPVNSQFPATAVGTATPVTQPIQVHFDTTNPPLIGPGIPVGTNIVTTTTFSIAPGTTDFTIDTTDPEFPLSILASHAYAYNQTTANFGMYPTPAMTLAGTPALPTCAQLGLSSPDATYDCLVYVTFKPTQPGLRTGQLVVTTANHSIYNFQLTGIGTGGQLAIDGGQQATVANAANNGLGATSAVAVNSAGTAYIADPSNNRIVVCSGSQCATQTTLSVTGLTPAGLKGPMGVALDAANNIYISDTGNNRIIKVNPVTNVGTVLGNYLWVPGATCDGSTQASDCPGSSTSPIKTTLANEPGASVTATTAPPQYQFNAPQGLAVDAWGNVYVADTGNAAIVEITSNTALGGAVRLFQYTGAPTFTAPVAVAVDSNGYVYVADQQNPAGEIVRIPPGGGDLQPRSAGATSALSVLTTLPLFGGQGITTPNGVAVDAAGNVYVSDSGTNTVQEAPATGPPSGTPFTLSFSGLNGPAGLALDPSGNLYVADSGNKQILIMNRQNPNISFGNVPLDLGLSGTTGTPTPAQPLCANTIISNGLNIGTNGTNCVVTVSNIGNQPVTLTSPFLGPTGNPAFSVTTAGSLTTCASPIPVGTTCTISPLFIPTSAAGASGSVTVSGTQSLALTANGASPEVKIVLVPSNPSSGTAPNYTAAAAAEVITATVSQPHVTGASTPTGTVTFSYVIDAGTANAGLCGAPGTSGPVTLSGGVATYTMPTLVQGQIYTVSAVYTPVGDSQDSITSATPIVLTVPGTSGVTVTATSVTYTYGAAAGVPAITGTVTPAPATGVTYKFTSGASQCSATGTYPIQVVFSGTGANQTTACGYGFPSATNSGSGGGPATVTENKANLTVGFSQPFTTVYGAAAFNFVTGMVITGASPPSACNDLVKLSATFSPVDTSVLDVNPTLPAVNPYPVIATMTGKPIGNYTVTKSPGTDTVTAAPSGTGITPTYLTGANTSAGLGAAGYILNAAATFTGTATSGSASVTGIASTAGLVVGEQITSSILGSGVTIKTINSGTAITLSANTTAAGTVTFTAGTAAATYAISVGSLVTAGKGTPTGTVTVYDTFVPITPTVFVPTSSTGAVPTFCSATLTTNCVSTVVPVLPCAGGVTTNCNPPVVVTLGGTLSAPTPGLGTFVMPSTYPNYTAMGTHYFSFLYSGDAGTNGDGLGDFACSVVGQAATTTPACPSTGAVPSALIVDGPDFTLTSNTGPIIVNPGVVPSGNGLPGTSTTVVQSTVLQIAPILGFSGLVNLSCVTQNLAYVHCSVGQTIVVNNASQLVTYATIASGTTTSVVFDVYTPASLPIGFNTTGQLRTSATRTVLAFLPFGILAFCVRRRRRLSKALWVLIAIAAVSAGMSGCGGNQVDFYTPIPTGPQTVTVTASYTPPGGSTPTLQRSFVVPININ